MLIAPVFIPMAGCPHRCIYCNQATLHPGDARLPDEAELDEVAARYLGYARDPSSYDVRELAFYGGNFTGLSQTVKRDLLAAARAVVRRHGFDSIRVSARPDDLTAVEAQFLSGNGVRFVETGAQSMNDLVLELAERGHTAADVVAAVKNLQAAKIGAGVHLMLGLPGSDEPCDLESAEAVAALKPDTVRVHPTVVLKNSRLEIDWREGRYTPLTLDEAVSRTRKVLAVFQKAGIPVIRVGLHGDDELLSGRAVVAGPFHPSLRSLV
jgi:histone acetyltransferase (RNA polymerase elongator complex component)